MFRHHTCSSIETGVFIYSWIIYRSALRGLTNKTFLSKWSSARTGQRNEWKGSQFPKINLERASESLQNYCSRLLYKLQECPNPWKQTIKKWVVAQDFPIHVNGLTNRKTTWKTWKRKKRTYKMLLIYIVQLLSDHLCLLINRLNPFVLLYIRFLSRAYNSNWNYKSRSVSWLYFQGWNSKNLQVGELHRACILLFYVRCLF